MSPGVRRGSLALLSPASLTPLAPSQLALPVCLAAGLPALAPPTSQLPIPDPAPGCCPSLWAALLSLPPYLHPAAGRGKGGRALSPTTS